MKTFLKRSLEIVYWVRFDAAALNLRLKRANARWLPEQVGPFVELLAMADSPEWSEFWAATAA